jgi:hypothetical protein
MTRARLGVLVLSLLAIGGLIAGGLALALPGSASATPRVRPVQMVVFDCPGQPATVRPRTFIVTCADAGIQYDRLTWASWKAGRASGSGLLEVNDCTPYCAVGHFHAFPARVTLSGSATVRNHPGERAYTKMTVVLTGARPKYAHGLAPRVETISLPTAQNRYPATQGAASV